MRIHSLKVAFIGAITVAACTPILINLKMTGPDTSGEVRTETSG